MEILTTFNDESLSEQAEMVGGLVVSGQFLQSHPSTHSLGIPVAALYVVHFGHQQQGLVQVPGLEGTSKIRVIAVEPWLMSPAGTEVHTFNPATVFNVSVWT